MKKTILGIRILFLLTTIYLIVVGDIPNAIGILTGLVLTFVPEILNKYFKLSIPVAWHLFGVIFILASQWLGTYLRAYDVLPWWDVMLHAVSGVLIGLVGLLIVIWSDSELILFKKEKYGLLSIIVFLTASASASIWEMFEYFGDTYFGTNAQLGSLVDTMEDISICVIIGMVFAIILYIGLKSKRDNFLKRQVNELIKQNNKYI